jgi:hypothetical protein
MAAILEMRLKAEDLFSGLRDEEEQEPARELIVERSKGLDAIIEGYKKAIENFPNGHSREDNYRVCENAVHESYAPEDIAKFSVLFPKIQVVKFPYYSGDFCSGLYFSALINNCKKDSPILLDFSHYDKRLFNVGYRNSSKVILIEGNVGAWLGCSMSGGKIVLNGNAKESVGQNMSGGEIIINGNPGHTFGLGMTDGIIRINGRMDVRGSHYGGEVYHYDKLMFKNGELV